MPNVRVVSRNFMEMVAALPAAKLDELYGSPWTCQAVVRSLPPLAKQYVLRLLFVEAAVSSKSIQDWALPDALNKHKVAIDKLEQLRVLIEATERRKEVSYKLNPRLQKQLQDVLKTGGGVPRESLPASFAARVPSLVDLENYAMKQWEAVLLQLVSSAFAEASTVPMNSTLTATFQRAGLITTPKGKEPPKITDAGFQFLLMDTNSQLWQIVREYVASAEDRGMDSAELISFLLELGFLNIGEPYNLNTLSPMQQNVIKELAALGVLQIQSGTKDRWFIPTKLASNLSASISETSGVQPGEGFVVVETNFRIYAYTTSKLQAEILRLFVRLEYQLPNLVVGSLTKESVSTAFASGISSDEMISFLSKHAHPHAAKKTPVVPETVTDQIRLWENDRNRVQMSPAYMYKEFPTVETFEAVDNYARDIGALLWDEPSTQRLVGKAERHEEMRNFIRRQSSAPQRR
ncbi:transcription initiation factor TFIIH subunit 4 [Marchantia polymorpha subsp. ruderalis]|uniref:RNA polymerase II transcription factor B subunit 2 n=2 Tax=Marchantia polymorpha TaxID=3197 RepID=A0AAF6BRT8_MARPO|nr:hypothetical protein MARPO_0047s0044 [Marchantia polymorpha]BBN14722.1 hypothetical protein Mp_6g13920 [Marchantia polymorpha subsp. ruderalis]|eukprot:PTQ39061.1 hypothetical protein MARPO_0047s0044 [Marchantia polymorpha]